MATTLTPFLKLRVSSDLTNDAVYNLNRIDQLGSILGTTATNDKSLKALNNIIIETDAPSLGGNGVAGTLQLAALNVDVTRGHLRLKDDSTAQKLQIAYNSSSLATALRSLTFDTKDNDVTLTLEKDLTVTGANITISANTDTTLNIPIDGTTGQVLTTNGNNTWSFQDVSFVGSFDSHIDTWLPADGTEKTFTHNFGTLDATVQIYSTEDSSLVLSDEIVYNDTDNVTIKISELPPSTGYRVWFVKM